MNTKILSKNYEDKSNDVVVPINLLKSVLGLSEEFDGVEFDSTSNAIILHADNTPRRGLR